MEVHFHSSSCSNQQQIAIILQPQPEETSNHILMEKKWCLIILIAFMLSVISLGFDTLHTLVTNHQRVNMKEPYSDSKDELNVVHTDGKHFEKHLLHHNITPTMTKSPKWTPEELSFWWCDLEEITNKYDLEPYYCTGEKATTADDENCTSLVSQLKLECGDFSDMDMDVSDNDDDDILNKDLKLAPLAEESSTTYQDVKNESSQIHPNFNQSERKWK